jgi:hypothetical protein
MRAELFFSFSTNALTLLHVRLIRIIVFVSVIVFGGFCYGFLTKSQCLFSFMPSFSFIAFEWQSNS